MKYIKNNTPYGVVSKCYHTIDGKKYLVKSNTENKLEPYSEVMGSTIAKLLDIDTISYELIDANEFKDLKRFNGIKHFSICEISDENLKNYSSFLIEQGYKKEIIETIDGYRSLGLDMIVLVKMLILDAFIGNSDRHLNNFDIDVNPNSMEIKNEPVLDYGLSLLSMYKDSELSEEVLLYDKSLPYYPTHTEQIQEIIKYFNKNIKLFQLMSKEAFFEELYSVLEEKIFQHLSEKRVEHIKKYLDIRFDKFIAPYTLFTIKSEWL